MSKKKNETSPEEEVKQENETAEVPAADAAPAVDETAAANDRYLRLMAEYDNFRREVPRREKISIPMSVWTP